MAINIRDSLRNLMTGLGTGRSKLGNTFFTRSALSDYATVESAYSCNWVAASVVDIPALDATREWRTIQSDGAEEIAAYEQQLLMQHKVQKALQWSRVYGGAGIIMITDQDLTKPLRVELIKKGELKTLLVFDRTELMAESINYSDVLSETYRKPEYFLINNGSQRVHTSHVAKFYGRPLPPRLSMSTQGWGDSVLRKCLEDIKEFSASKAGIAELMQEANVDVVTKEGLADELASDQDDSIRKRYELFGMMKSNVRLALLDSTESYDRKTLALAGVSDVLDSFMTFVSGCSGIPVTKLFGTSAKGMNATGEGDLKNYYDTVRAQQYSCISPEIRALDDVLTRSALGSMPNGFDYEWNQLYHQDPLQKSQAKLNDSQTHERYLDTGVVDISQVRKQLQQSEQYQFTDDQMSGNSDALNGGEDG